MIITACAAIVLLSATFALWRFSLFFLNYRLREVTQQQYRQSVDTLANFIEVRLTALRHIHHFYASSENMTEQEFQSFCSSMLRDMPGIVSVMITDKRGHPTWLAPKEALPLNDAYVLTADPSLSQTLQQSLVTRQPAITATREIPTYGPGFLAALPIFIGKVHQGYIVGIFHYKSLLGYLIQPNALEQFQVTVIQQDREVFKTPTLSNPLVSSSWLSGTNSMQKGYRDRILLGGQEWTVILVPQNLKNNSPATFASITILVLGLLLSSLVSAIIFRWQWRSALLQTEAVNNRTRLERTGMNLLEVKSELNLILNSVDEGIIIYNNNFDPVQGNASFMMLFNLTDNGNNMLSGTAHHEHMIQAIGSETKYWSLFNSLRDHPEQAYTDELEILRAANGNRGYRAFLRRATSICGAEGEYRGVLVIYKDITDLKAVDRVKDDFLSNVTHELRSPLASIKGFAEMLRREPDMLLETRKEFINIICEETRRLQDLIDELLDLRRMEARGTPFNPTPYDLKVLVAEVVRSARTILISKNINVQLEWSGVYGSRLIGDIAQITRALHNLLVNAIKYSPEGTEIKLHGHCGKHRLWLEITDQGSGIEDQDLPFIFDKFYRGSRQRHQKGTGLGLAIVKHIIAYHGGHLGVRSEVGAGTTFRVEFQRDYRPPVRQTGNLPAGALPIPLPFADPNAPPEPDEETARREVAAEKNKDGVMTLALAENGTNGSQNGHSHEENRLSSIEFPDEFAQTDQSDGAAPAKRDLSAENRQKIAPSSPLDDSSTA